MRRRRADGLDAGHPHALGEQVSREAPTHLEIEQVPLESSQVLDHEQQHLLLEHQPLGGTPYVVGERDIVRQLDGRSRGRRGCA